MDSVGRAALEGAALGALAGGVGAAVGAAGLSGAAAFAVSEGADFIGGFLYDIGVNGLSREEALINGLMGIGFGGAIGLLGRGISRAARNVNLPLPRQLRRQCASFSAETMVATPDGDKPISEIEVGDVILAYSEATEEVDIYHVSATHTQHHETTLDVTIDGETLHTTDEHPFYVVRDNEEQWVQAKHLQADDRVLAADGTLGVVEAIEIVDQPQTMYNLTVSLVATYLVGDGQWVVHNSDFCSIDYYISGLSERNQTAMVEAIRQSDPNLIIAARPRALGAAHLDGTLMNKPESAEKIYKLGAGARLISVPQVAGLGGDRLGTNRTMVAISDLDIGLVARNTGSGFTHVPDDQFISMIYDPVRQLRLPNPNGRLPGNLINRLNGADIVMHGSLVDGLVRDVVSLYDPRFPPMFDEELWFVFGETGLINYGLGQTMTNQYLPHIWKQIQVNE